MAKIPTPDRGQPLDVSYIYQIVEAINDLSTQMSSSTYKYASIDTTSGTQNSLINEMKVVAGQISVSDESITVGKTASYNYSFKGEYKYPPVVVVTPQLQTVTAAGKNISVVVESVTNSRVDISVTYNTSGSASYKLNILAIGVPN